MKVCQDFSKYMSGFLMDFSQPKFFEKYANTNEKFIFPSKNIIFFMRILMIVIFFLNLALTILSWFCKNYPGASAFTFTQVLFAFSLIFEPIIQKRKILVLFHGMFYIITMLLYSSIYKVFLSDILGNFKFTEQLICQCSEFYEILSILFALFRSLNWYIPSLSFIIMRILSMILLLYLHTEKCIISAIIEIILSILYVGIKSMIIYIVVRGMKISFLAQYFLSKVG